MITLKEIESLNNFALTMILDAYVTKNGIEDFLVKEGNFKDRVEERNIFFAELTEELDIINQFLEDDEHYIWAMLKSKKEFFDKNLPKYKRKIKWFHRPHQFPFDYSLFFRNAK